MSDPFRLVKTRPRKVFDNNLPSALWEIKELPGIYLVKASASKKSQERWIFFESSNIAVENKGFGLQKIINQEFQTRRDALQALRAITE